MRKVQSANQYLFFSFLIFLFFSFNTIGIFVNFLNISLLGFLLVYLMLVIKAIIIHGGLSLYSLYLYMSFLFVYSKILFGVVGYASLTETYWLSHHIYSIKTVYLLIFSAFIHHFVLDIYMTTKKNKMPRLQELSNNYLIQKIGIIILTISLPVCLYKSFLTMNAMKKIGYMAIYSGTLGTIQFPFWTKGCETLLFSGFLLTLMSKPTIKAWWYSVFALFSVLFVAALRGGRATFLTAVFTCVWFYTRYLNKKIKKRLLITGGVILILFAMIIGQVREKPSEKKANVSTNSVISFFMDQGTSFYSAISMIEWRKEQASFRKYPYIFSPLMQPIYDIVSPETKTGSKPSKEILIIRNLGESIISYISSPNGYLEGYGLGATFIGEMYDCGGFLGVFIWSILLGFLICFVEKYGIRTRAFLPISWYVVNSVIFLPRGRFFEFFLTSYKSILVLILFFICLKFITFQKYVEKK